MAGKSGRNLYFNLDDSAGTPTDLSTLITGADLADDVGMEDSTTAGPTRTATEDTVLLTSGTISVRAPYSATLWAHLAALKGHANTQTFDHAPEGNTSGKPHTTGECRLLSLRRTADATGQLRIEAELKTQGTVTEELIA